MHAADREEQFTRDRIAMIAHELKRPATNVIEVLDQVLEGAEPLTAHQRALVTRARENATHMRDLVDDVESAARLREGSQSVAKSPQDLRSLVNDAIERCAYPAAAKSITLLSELPATPIRVSADRAMLLQLLSNLISNAIKFSNAGTTVRVGARRAAGGAECWVTDHGQGMQPQDLPHLFRRFPRTTTRATRGEPSTGLGLYIVSEVLRLHDGTISVTTEPGKGSTFVFQLPHADAPKSTPRRRIASVSKRVRSR